MACGIVTAAGSGTRLGLGVPKSEVELLGKPILFYSLQAFEKADSIDSVILVLSRERVDAWPLDRLKAGEAGKVSAVVAGGDTRQGSVRNALELVEDDIVVVHDGARPLVTPALIDAAADLPAGADGLVAAVPATDTIKEVHGDVVRATLERDGLVCVQTPQGFRTEALVEAHRRALADGFAGTDDASLVERAGGRVKVIPGSRENIKVTFMQDMVLAGAMLAERGRS